MSSGELDARPHPLRLYVAIARPHHCPPRSVATVEIGVGAD